MIQNICSCPEGVVATGINRSRRHTYWIQPGLKVPGLTAEDCSHRMDEALQDEFKMQCDLTFTRRSNEAGSNLKFYSVPHAQIHRGALGVFHAPNRVDINRDRDAAYGTTNFRLMHELTKHETGHFKGLGHSEEGCTMGSNATQHFLLSA